MGLSYIGHVHTSTKHCIFFEDFGVCWKGGLGCSNLAVLVLRSSAYVVQGPVPFLWPLLAVQEFARNLGS